MASARQRGEVFRRLHAGSEAFVMPNPWDVGSARLLAGMGFQALATTSAGYAFSVGRCDGAVGRDEMMRHVERMTGASELPMSGDLENGYGDDPATVAETIGMAARAGLVGGSIEDSTSRTDEPIYELGRAADRIRAAADAAGSLDVPFMLTGRCENFLWGRPDLADTIRRLQAYQEAGADVLYAPGLASREDIASVVASVDRPLNVLMGRPGFDVSVAELSALGVRRISVGASLARVALGAFLGAAREIAEDGTFGFGEHAIPAPEISKLLG